MVTYNVVALSGFLSLTGFISVSCENPAFFGDVFMIVPPLLSSDDGQIVFHLVTVSDRPITHHDSFKKQRVDLQVYVYEMVRGYRLHHGQGHVFRVNATSTSFYVGFEILHSTLMIVSKDDENMVSMFIRFQVFEETQAAPRLLKTQLINVGLFAYQGYTLNYCADKYKKYLSLTGSTIIARTHIGVVSGNCYALTSASFCKDSTKNVLHRTGNIATEMMAPFRYSGTEFVMPVIRSRANQTRAVILSCNPRTLVDVYTSEESFQQHNLREVGETAILKVFNRPFFVKSDKPIVVAYYLVAPACEGETGFRKSQESVDPSFTLVVPTGLFYNYYLWSAPKEAKDRVIDNWIILIVRTDDIRDIFFNGFSVVLYLTGNPVVRLNGWRLFSLSASWGLHELWGSTATFGCYLYGIREALTYFHHAGFANYNLNTDCRISVGSMMPGDLVDNDCDQEVDEETLNGLDDDKDLLIDEDLKEVESADAPQPQETTPDKTKVQTLRVATAATTAKKTQTTKRDKRPRTTKSTPTTTATMSLVDGEIMKYFWSEWTEWECTKDCSDSRMVQYRTCNVSVPFKCIEDSQRYKTGACYVNDTCPRACPEGTWGLNCVGKCTNCDPDCDKFTGACRLCKAGFQTPNQSCNSKCGPFRYGFDCSEDCMLKCKKDCSERVTGLCPVGLLTKFLPLVLLIPVIPLVVLSLLGHKIKNMEDTESLPNANEFKMI